MITYVYANNYKTFVNFKIDFEQINLLIGQNGVGKSNILKLITILRDIIQGRNPNIASVLCDTTTKWLKSDIQSFELGLSDENYEYIYRLEVEHNIQMRQTRLIEESVYRNGVLLYQMKQGNTIMYSDNRVAKELIVDPTTSGVVYIPQDGEHNALLGFRQQIDKIILCNPNPKTMMDIVQNDMYIPNIGFENIVSVYAGLIQLDTEIYNNLTRALTEINPSFVKPRIEINIQENAKYLLFDYKYNDVLCKYRFSELSDGEKMLFALYVLLYGFINRGYTILLDEPDNYISLKEIQPWCAELEDLIDKNGQCLIISHNPEVIDYMAETRGKWFGRLKSGESKVVNEYVVGENKDLLTYSQMIARGYLDEVK